MQLTDPAEAFHLALPWSFHPDFRLHLQQEEHESTEPSLQPDQKRANLNIPAIVIKFEF